MKWNNCISSPVAFKGAGSQVGTARIIEYISQTNLTFNFLDTEDILKFIDDASFMKLLNLISNWISSYNCKVQVSANLSPDSAFIPTNSLKTHTYLNKTGDWTNAKR